MYWTRFFIISTAADLGDLEAVTNRLLRNPKEFEQLLRPFYGTKESMAFRNLLTEHLMIGGDLVNATKKGDKEAADKARKKWYRNADEIAAFLSALNPCWDEKRWICILYSHLEMTEKEAALRLAGNYEADIKIFESIENEAMEMADYMACGIYKQCCR